MGRAGAGRRHGKRTPVGETLAAGVAAAGTDVAIARAAPGRFLVRRKKNPLAARATRGEGRPREDQRRKDDGLMLYDSLLCCSR